MSMIFCRKASVQGVKHIQRGYNNQDAMLLESFTIPAFGKTFTIGLVADGCSGLPGFSKTEVGANLLVLYAYNLFQDLVCSGVDLPNIPAVLYRACTEFMRDLANKVMPSNTVWPYPAILKPILENRKDGRLTWNSTQRFKSDYLSTTFLGFITDGEIIVVFIKGDGIVLVNDNLTVIDQNDEPEYMAATINQPGEGFEVQVFQLSDIRRIAISGDGLKHLMQEKDGFIEQMYSHMPGHMLGLQFLLQVTRENEPENMGDDCTAVTLENSEYVEESDDQPADDVEEPTQTKEDVK